MTPAEKAARTRKLRALELAARQKHLDAFEKGPRIGGGQRGGAPGYCEKHRWPVAFFEGVTGSPRTGIIDAIIFRISKSNADVPEHLGAVPAPSGAAKRAWETIRANRAKPK